MDGTTEEAPVTEKPFALSSQTLGALPIVDRFLARMRVDALLDRFIPARDARVALAPAKAIGLLVRNLCCATCAYRASPYTRSGSGRPRWTRRCWA